MLKEYVLFMTRRHFYFCALGIVSFLFVVFSPTVVKAREYGISGEIGVTYTEDEFKSESTNASLTSIEQRYRLNYRNFIYRPRLLTYFLSGTFTKENGKSNDSKAEATSKDYDIRLNFLSETPYPFFLWASKQSPTSFTFLSGGQTFFTKQRIESFGLDGGFYFRGLPRLKYTLKQQDRTTTSQTLVTDERERNFLLNLNQNMKNSSVELNYEYKSILNRITLSEEISHDFRLTGNTGKRLSMVSNINANAEFHKNTFSDITEIKGATSFNYFPSDRLNSKLAANYNRTMLPAGNADNFSTTINANYKLSNAFTTIGDGSFFYNTATSGNSTSENLAASLNYSELIAKDRTLSAGTSLGLGAYQGTPYNRTTLSTGLSSRLIQNLPTVKSILSTGGSANYFSSSAGGKNENFYWDLTGNSQFIEKLTASQQFRYQKEKTEADTVNNETGTTSSTKKLSSDTSLSYFTFLNIDARLDLKTGLLMERGEANTASRKSFYTDETLSYNIRRNLSMRANSRYQYESNLSSKTIFLNLEFNYRIRKIFATLRYNWRNEKQETASSETTHTFLEIVRPF